MANADLERFRLKVREYRLLVNRNQSDLAAYINLDYNELSSRLNANKKVRLSHDNVRAMVRALAEWGAITTRAQAEELLDIMLCLVCFQKSRPQTEEVRVKYETVCGKEDMYARAFLSAGI